MALLCVLRHGIAWLLTGNDIKSIALALDCLFLWEDVLFAATERGSDEGWKGMIYQRIGNMRARTFCAGEMNLLHLAIT